MTGVSRGTYLCRFQPINLPQAEETHDVGNTFYVNLERDLQVAAPFELQATFEL